jgi:hypothetical protein
MINHVELVSALLLFGELIAALQTTAQCLHSPHVLELLPV